MEYMKRKHARSGASPLTCRSILNIGRILAERRVALMLHCCVRGVERDIGLHTLLDAPSQFLELWIALLAENANSLSHYVRMAQAGNCFKTVVSYQQEIRRGVRSVGEEAMTRRVDPVVLLYLIHRHISSCQFIPSVRNPQLPQSLSRLPGDHDRTPRSPCLFDAHRFFI